MDPACLPIMTPLGVRSVAGPAARRSLRVAPAAAVALAAALAACATTGPKGARVDLAPAREALEDARQAGAPQRAAETFTRAQGHLNEAEALVKAARGHRAAEKARQAEWLARLAAVEARCAAAQARLTVQSAEAAQQAAAEAAGEAERLSARLRRTEEEQRRLEEKVALLQRDLDYTETEVIRTKARLKGIETRAEASSAIAEARILTRRLAEHRGLGATLVRCQEQLVRAEQLLQEENYGAAIFFAMKAQDTALKAHPGEDAPRPDDAGRPAAKSHYVVTASRANIRRGPSIRDPVLVRAVKGTTVLALIQRGDWIRVVHRDVTGWIHRSVVE
jgi:hypothetical protein